MEKTLAGMLGEAQPVMEIVLSPCQALAFRLAVTEQDRQKKHAQQVIRNGQQLEAQAEYVGNEAIVAIRGELDIPAAANIEFGANGNGQYFVRYTEPTTAQTLNGEGEGRVVGAIGDEPAASDAERATTE